MTISSLQDLNTYALTPITYTDLRTAQVIFDRGATVDQALTINENNTFVFPWGININDVTQYDVAEVQYTIDLSTFTSPVNITWPAFPAHMTVSRVGTTNVWVVDDIRSRDDWLLARQATVQPEFGFSGSISFTGTISYYSDNQDSSREQVAWDVNLTVTPVEYFTAAPTLTYVSNEIKTNMSTVSITNAGAGSFDPEWTLTVTATAGTIAGFTADASPAEFSIDPSTGTVTIIGDTQSVNDVLASLDVYFARSDADCLIFFSLTNDLSDNQDLAIQLIESRDFISDQSAAFSKTTAENIIYGGEAEVTAISSVTTDNIRIKPLGAEFGGVFGASGTGRADFSGYATVPSEFGSIFYFIWADIQSEFSILARPHVWYVESSTQAGPIYGDEMFTKTNSSTIRRFDLATGSITGSGLSDPDAPSTSFGTDTSVDSDGTYVVVGNFQYEDTSYAVSNQYGTAHRFTISTASATRFANPDLYPAPSTPTSAEVSDDYGRSVAMSDTYTIIGAPYESASASDHGSVGAVYVWNTSTGTVLWEIPNPIDDFTFGLSVDISDDYFVVSMHNYVDGTDTIGRVYLFNTATGVQETYWDRPSDDLPSGADSEFGANVKISGNYVCVFDTGYGDKPAIYVYDATTRQLIWKRISTTANSFASTITHNMDVNSTSVGAFIDDYWSIFNLATGELEHRFTNADMGFGTDRQTTFFMDDNWAVFETAANQAVIIQI